MIWLQLPPNNRFNVLQVCAPIRSSAASYRETGFVWANSLLSLKPLVSINVDSPGSHGGVLHQDDRLLELLSQRMTVERNIRKTLAPNNKVMTSGHGYAHLYAKLIGGLCLALVSLTCLTCKRIRLDLPKGFISASCDAALKVFPLLVIPRDRRRTMIPCRQIILRIRRYCLASPQRLALWGS